MDAAIAVADAEGSDAISMRRIAQVLRAGTMSLYWHVANKEHLLDLMLDVLITEVSVPEPSGDWRADLRTLARNDRAMLLRHRWVMDFVGGRPPLGPNTLLNLDRSLALLDGLGLEIPTAMNILGTVQTYVMGAVLREMREMRGPARPGRGPSVDPGRTGSPCGPPGGTGWPPTAGSPAWSGSSTRASTRTPRRPGTSGSSSASTAS